MRDSGHWAVGLDRLCATFKPVSEIAPPPARHGRRSAVDKAPAVPADFQEVLPWAVLYLNRSIDYDWAVLPRHGLCASEVTLGEPCVVICGGLSSKGYATAPRCLAFADEVGGKVRWHGVTGPWQAPAELADVDGFVPLSELDIEVHQDSVHIVQRGTGAGGSVRFQRNPGNPPMPRAWKGERDGA